MGMGAWPSIGDMDGDGAMAQKVRDGMLVPIREACAQLPCGQLLDIPCVDAGCTQAICDEDQDFSHG